MVIFDGLPISEEKAYLKEELLRIDESWTTARFDSLPHVVHILTSKDRDGEAQHLKEQSDIIEDVVDEVVHAYHSGFNRAIQNYSQILRLFSESAESISVLKVDLAEAKSRLGARNKQLHQLWYRSVTLRHIISLLDQIEGIAKVPARIEKLIAEKQLYAAVQLHVQSSLMLEREGLQTVGALQDVRSELTKLRGVLFFKVVEDLHAHLYNKGEFSSAALGLFEGDEEVPTTTSNTFSLHNSQSQSRRTRSARGDSQSVSGERSFKAGSYDAGASFDGHDDENIQEQDDASLVNGGVAGGREVRSFSRQIPKWLSSATPDEFLEAIKKSDFPLHVKYLQTMVECLFRLGKVAAAGAIISQRLRQTVHEIITSKIKSHAELANSMRPGIDRPGQTAPTSLHFLKAQLVSYQSPKHKLQNGTVPGGMLLAVSPVSSAMAPMGKAQSAAKELLNSILDTVVRIFENHVIVGELLEVKSTQQSDLNTPKSMTTDFNWTSDPEASQIAGGYSVGVSLAVLQSECQQLICEILRATPEAASADVAAQTARLANKAPFKENKDGSEDGLAFAFRFTDVTMSVPNQGAELIRQGWSKRGTNALKEGYGSAAAIPEQGIYLAASVYRPIVQFTDKINSMIPKKYLQHGNDGLLAFVENFVKEHFLPTMFVDYRKGVQQAISSPAAFRPRAHAAATYSPLVEKGRPVLQGLLAIDFLAKEVLGWAQAMPKFAGDLVKYVQTFLERSYERCRASYMEAVLEKQSYMLIGRHDIEKLLKRDPAGASLPDAYNSESIVSDTESLEVEKELGDLLLGLRPIKQVNLIRDDNKLILLASLSDSLEYIADSIESLGDTYLRSNPARESERLKGPRHSRTTSSAARDLTSFADEYRRLATDCLKVLRIEMQLETIFHLQEMTNREYLEDQDAEEPDDFIISLTSLIMRRDEEIAPFVAGVKRNYIFGGICSIAANASIKGNLKKILSLPDRLIVLYDLWTDMVKKFLVVISQRFPQLRGCGSALADMKSINLFGVQQICRNSIALEQALAAIPSIDNEAVQHRLDRVRTYYELLNMPFEALIAFITEHEHLFTATEYTNLLKVQVPGREIPPDGHDRVMLACS